MPLADKPAAWTRHSFAAVTKASLSKGEPIDTRTPSPPKTRTAMPGQEHHRPNASASSPSLSQRKLP